MQRASALVHACISVGYRVTVASGGEPLPGAVFTGAKVVQLPPLRSANAQFSGLVDSAGNLIDEKFKTVRKALLLDAFEASDADVLLIENYPFGRRQLRWELLPLLELAQSKKEKPLIVCSIRDVLQKRKEKREIETAEVIERFFDLVLVHGRPDFISLDESYSLTSKIRDKVMYTGFVVKADQTQSAGGTDGQDEVIISAGGGAVGFAVMELAVRARKSGYMADCNWRFLIGPNMPDFELERLKSYTQDGCLFEPARPDFPALLSGCRLSVSQAGYNTVLDILRAECPSLLIPFESGGESEQLMRTIKLAESGRCAFVRENKLTVENFTLSASLAMKQNTAIPNGVDCNGAGETATLIRQQWQLNRGR